MADWKNKLYFGDNLDILCEHIADESVDLIYLDPPFNSLCSFHCPVSSLSFARALDPPFLNPPTAGSVFLRINIEYCHKLRLQS